MEGWKQRESQKTEVIEQLQRENEQLRTTQEHQQGVRGDGLVWLQNVNCLTTISFYSLEINGFVYQISVSILIVAWCFMKFCDMVIPQHYSDVIISVMASQITSVSFVCPSICSGADQRKHQSSASLTFVRGIHRWPVDSPHIGPVTQKMFPFDDVLNFLSTGAKL